MVAPETNEIGVFGQPGSWIGSSSIAGRDSLNWMEAVTHLYTYPEAVEREEGRAEVEAALEKLSAELQLPHALVIKPGHVGRITVPDTAPDETWAAMGRAVTNWPELFLPRPAG
jgi:hypothetical protein